MEHEHNEQHGWVAVSDCPPPPGIWIHTTRKLGDPEYTGTCKFNDDIDILAECNDVGFTHWTPVSSDKLFELIEAEVKARERDSTT